MTFSNDLTGMENRWSLTEAFNTFFPIFGAILLIFIPKVHIQDLSTTRIAK